MKYFVTVLMVAAGFFAGGLYVINDMNQPPYSMESQSVTIQKGMTATHVARMLKSMNLINNQQFFAQLNRVPGFGPLKKGTFRINEGMTSTEIFKKLSSDDIETITVTIPEGYNLYQIAEALEAENICRAEDFLTLAFSRQTARKLGIEAATLEGYLFPDTYHLTENRDPMQIITLLHNRLKKMLAQNNITLTGKELHKVLTLASLVEAEATVRGEQTIIASVFHNRLKKNMRMDCDPTVRYAVKRFTEPIRKSDLQYDSPYNTYRVRGLPPGPICSPGIHAIQATLNPADTDYLFFVSRNDRSHYFSPTYKEHDRAVQFYQRGADNGFIDRQKRYR